jgi:RNA polymerase sigma factor (sigma-70 family)
VQPTDEELVAAVLAGEQEKFGDLLERYQARLVNYLYRLVHDLEESHDLAQEVFVKVYYALDRFDPSYRFSTWLFRVAQNAAIDQIRRRRLKLVSMQRPEEGGEESHEWEFASPGPSPYGDEQAGPRPADVEGQAVELPDRLDAGREPETRTRRRMRPW